MKPLNPALYGALRRLFGEVRIYKEGQPPALSRRNGTIHVVDGGEEYAVCCPFCGDRRFRLYINHRYYHPNDPGKHLFAWRAHCFNEECLEDAANRARLREIIIRAVSSMPVDPALSEPVQAEPRPVSLPDRLLPLAEAAEHLEEIRDFLRSRHIDPDSMHRWEAYICLDDSSINYGRIVVPIRTVGYDAHGNYAPGMVVGYQTRSIDGLVSRDHLKYRSVGRIGMGLYNIVPAVRSGRVILVEGFLDAWRVGPAGVPVLGSSLSHAQADIMIRMCRNVPVTIMLDGDAVKKAKDIYRTLSSAGIDCRLAVLPGRLDPCDLDSESLDRVLNRASV